MSPNDPDSARHSPKPEELRRQAEQLLLTTREGITGMSAEELLALVQELQALQMKMEIQNEELRQAHMELAASRDRYFDLYESAPCGYLNLAKDGRILEANLTAATLLGVACRDLIGADFTRFVAPGDHRAYQIHQQKTVADSHSRSCELGIRRGDGSSFAARLESSAITGDAEAHDGIRTALSDITAHRQALEALYREHEFNEQIIATSNLIILQLDPKGRVVRCNRYFEKLTGWKSDELRGRDWFTTFIPERERERLTVVLEEAVEGIPKLGIVNPIIVGDGSERLIEWYNAPLKDLAGTITGLLCTGTDITDRRRLEQEVINAAEDERHRTARDIHDGLGSLLTGIGLQAQALVKTCCATCDPAPAKAAARISELIQKAIREANAIARGMHPVGPNPKDLVVTLNKLIIQANESSPATCRFDCHDPILIDAPQTANHLYRIAQEALNNAIKYSRAEHITVSLKESPGFVVLTVEDDGVGFDRQRLKSKGLGLHVMNYRANAINANLEIKRAKQRGTILICAVPIGQPHSGPEEAHRNQHAGDQI